MTELLCLDLATTTGWARGCVGDRAPTCGSVNFAGTKGDASDNAIFGNALRIVWHLLDEPQPQIIFLEAMLPPAAMRGRTSRAVRDRLAGLHGIVRACAFRRGIYRVELASVGDVRAHFIGDRKLARYPAKQEVTRTCQRLGWPVKDDNQADAAALWSFACGLIDPASALRVSPLFARGVAL